MPEATNLYAAYLTWLADNWSKARLARIVEPRGSHKGESLYTDAAIEALAERYSKLENYTDSVGSSLKNSLSTVLQPYLPPQQTKIGIYFRDWPVPCFDRKAALAPVECGGAVVPANIMCGAIERVLSNERRYVTLSRGLRAAHEVVKSLDRECPDDFEVYVLGCVVGDLVKLQALFKGVDGSDFQKSLSKRSCHSWGMYEFAGNVFAEELNMLQLKTVIGFGSESVWKPALESMKNVWRIHIVKDNKVMGVPNSDLKFYLLPHPQAFGGALQRCIRLVTGVEIDLEPLSTDNPEADLDLESNSIQSDNPLYTVVEDWIEEQFGGWDVEPHHANGVGLRTFKPEGKKRGAIYGSTPRGRYLVFRCLNRDKWLLPDAVPGFRIKRGNDNRYGTDDRLWVHIPKDADLSMLNSLLLDWKS
jgi:hypothetical protein